MLKHCCLFVSCLDIQETDVVEIGRPPTRRGNINTVGTIHAGCEIDSIYCSPVFEDASLTPENIRAATHIPRSNKSSKHPAFFTFGLNNEVIHELDTKQRVERTQPEVAVYPCTVDAINLRTRKLYKSSSESSLTCSHSDTNKSRVISSFSLESR